MSKHRVVVRQLPPDDFSRPQIQNVESGAIYVDVSCGDARYQPIPRDIPGDWHTVTDYGEPYYRISREVEFVLAEGVVAE